LTDIIIRFILIETHYINHKGGYYLKKIIGIFIVTLLIGTVVSQVSACTGFTASKDENVLVGCNFDWSRDFNVYMNFFPVEEGKFGRILFDLWWPYSGFDYTLAIQGMNDQGLFVDTYMVPEHTVDYSGAPFFESDDPDYYDDALWAYCLAKCSTISEVLDIYNQYDQEWPDGISTGQLFFVDRNGDSLIIEDYDSMIFKEGDFQVITNFLQSQPELGGYPCWRYDTAVSMLENMSDLNVDYFTSICNATHGTSSVFSNVYDLKQEKIWIHYYYNYNNVLEIDLNEELANGERRSYLGSLFEPEDNQPPDKPDAPTGEISGLPGEDFDYRASKTPDPNEDNIMYLFDWDDGTDSGWIMPTVFGSIKATHNWTERGDYEVKVKARDHYGAESEWSDPFTVTMPKSKSFNIFNPLIIRLIQRFPILEFLL